MECRNKEVIKRILARKNGAKDKHKIGLLIQGGGMKGVFSGGVMIALEEAGLADCFDVIYGISAGSFAGAYLLSHETRLGTSIYYEDLNGFKFIQPWRIGKMMNMDYFCDHVVRELKPIKEDMIRNSKTTFKVIVANEGNDRTYYFSNKDEGVDLVEVMKASSAYPGFYYPLVEINGKDFVDGNSFVLFPEHIILKDDLTDLLIVSNSAEDFNIHESTGISRLLYNLLTLPLGKAFKRRYHDTHCKFCDQADCTFGRKKMPGNFNFYTVAPDYTIAETEIRRKKLIQTALHGESKMKDILADLEK